MKKNNCWDCEYLGKCPNASKNTNVCQSFRRYKEYLTYADIAEIAGISERTIYRNLIPIKNMLKAYQEKTGIRLLYGFDNETGDFGFIKWGDLNDDGDKL